MTLIQTTLLLPPNVVDVYMTDVDGDESMSSFAKGSGGTSPD